MKVDDGNDEIQFVTVPNNKISTKQYREIRMEKKILFLSDACSHFV